MVARRLRCQEFPSRTWIFLVSAIVFVLQRQFTLILVPLSSISWQDDGPQGSKNRTPPLILQIKSNNTVTRLDLQDTPEYYIQNRTNNDWIDNGTKQLDRPEIFRLRGCVPLGDWQDAHHPSCLNFHAIDMPSNQITKVATGNSRETWMVDEYNGTKLALKTLRAFRGNKTKAFYDHAFFEMNRIDAVASAQLAASPYAMNIHGHCAYSALHEYTDGGHLWDIIPSAKPEKGQAPRTLPTKNELLKYAVDVAMGVADSQLVDSMGRITLLHHDIRPSQFLWTDGRYKINDFNLAYLVSWDLKQQRYCGTK